MVTSTETNQACQFKVPEQACQFKAPEPTDLKQLSKAQATQYFADTIDQFSGELTGKELFECFVKAAKEIFSYAYGQYHYAHDLLTQVEEAMPEEQSNG